MVQSLKNCMTTPDCFPEKSYRSGVEITMEHGAMGKSVEVYDAKMKGLEIASRLVHDLFNSMVMTLPSRIVISTDNMGAIQQIFQGSPGKAQTSSMNFHRHILDLLDKHKELRIALMWCPGHFDLEGNERANELAKSGSHLTPKYPNYKSLSYLGVYINEK